MTTIQVERDPIPPPHWSDTLVIVERGELVSTTYAIEGPHDKVVALCLKAREWIGFSHPNVVRIDAVTEEGRTWDMGPGEDGSPRVMSRAEVHCAGATGAEVLAQVRYSMHLDPGAQHNWLTPQLPALADAVAAMARRRPPACLHQHVNTEVIRAHGDARAAFSPVLKFSAPIEGFSIGIALDDKRREEARLAWASPEELRGQVLTPSADVFTLAMVMYTLLALKRPFLLGDSMFDTMKAIVDGPEPAPLPPQFPHSLATLVARNLSREPAKRDQTPADFAASLRACVAR